MLDGQKTTVKVFFLKRITFKKFRSQAMERSKGGLQELKYPPKKVFWADQIFKQDLALCQTLHKIGIFFLESELMFLGWSGNFSDNNPSETQCRIVRNSVR